jgi:DNA-binding MarR family transcriptional regulator
VGPAVSDLRRVFNDLIRFETEVWNAADARLKSDFDLPLTHFEPMSVIDRVPGCRVYDIATELSITTGGASRLVDRIEASGYCRRLPNPADRRSSLLELTPEGQRIAADDVQSQVIPDCGHYCLEEAPDGVLAALTAFLQPYAAAGHSG